MLLYPLSIRSLEVISISVRKYRRGNHKWTIQRNWQHMLYKTKKNKTKPQHNMSCTPLYASKHTQKKQIRHDPSKKTYCCLHVSITCSHGAICLSTDCCFSELELCNPNKWVCLVQSIYHHHIINSDLFSRCYS